MVVKLNVLMLNRLSLFESRVILDGSQTSRSVFVDASEFESRVILDGSQTAVFVVQTFLRFESRVILDGSQTEQRDKSNVGGV